MRRIILGTLVSLGVLLPFTLTPAAGRGGTGDTGPLGAAGPALQEADTVVIFIVPDADSVRAEPDVVTVYPGQFVTWETDLGDWTVKFRSGQPFGDRAVGEGIKGNRGQRRGQAVRDEAAPGRYKYDILVQVQGGRNLRADPEVVITPGGSR